MNSVLRETSSPGKRERTKTVRFSEADSKIANLRQDEVLSVNLKRLDAQRRKALFKLEESQQVTHAALDFITHTREIAEAGSRIELVLQMRKNEARRPAWNSQTKVSKKTPFLDMKPSHGWSRPNSAASHTSSRSLMASNIQCIDARGLVLGVPLNSLPLGFVADLRRASSSQGFGGGSTISSVAKVRKRPASSPGNLRLRQLNSILTNHSMAPPVDTSTHLPMPYSEYHDKFLGVPQLEDDDDAQEDRPFSGAKHRTGRGRSHSSLGFTTDGPSAYYETSPGGGMSKKQMHRPRPHTAGSGSIHRESRSRRELKMLTHIDEIWQSEREVIMEDKLREVQEQNFFAEEKMKEKVFDFFDRLDADKEVSPPAESWKMVTRPKRPRTPNVFYRTTPPSDMQIRTKSNCRRPCSAWTV